MEFTGEYLKEARRKKNLTVEKIAEELKISKGILLDIENDHFPEYYDTVYLLGHIRSYSQFLNLDTEKIIENFKIQVSYNTKNTINEISKPIYIPNILNYSKHLSFFSVVIIISGFYFLFVKPNSNIERNYAMTPDIPENLSYDLEEIEMNLDLNNKLNQSKTDNMKLVLMQEIDDTLINSSSAIASSYDINDNNDFNEITLKFINPTWIQLRDKNDEIIFSKLMDQGDEYTYNLSQEFNLTSGNAGNIIVSLDGIVKGRAGKVGEVIDSLVIDNNFNN